MTQAKAGDTVAMHYTGTLSDGSIFDSSDGRDPLEFAVGSGQIIPGLDAAIPGMAVGDKKTVNVPVDQAYGPIDPANQQAVPRSEFPDDIPMEVGTQLQLRSPDGGQVMPVVITQVTDDEVTLDANHPLAGRDLIFDIEIMSIS